MLTDNKFQTYDVIAIKARDNKDIQGYLYGTILLAQNISSRQADEIVRQYKRLYHVVHKMGHPNGVDFVNVGKKHKIIPQ